jgi:hypothetical protein
MTNAMPVRYPSAAPTWAPRIARPVKMSVVRMPFTGGLTIVIRAGDLAQGNTASSAVGMTVRILLVTPSLDDHG